MPGAPRTPAPTTQGCRDEAGPPLANGRRLCGAAGKTTQIVDLGGAFVVPGFTDRHTHFTMGSLRLSQVALDTAMTPAEFPAQIGAAASKIPQGR